MTASGHPTGPPTFPSRSGGPGQRTTGVGVVVFAVAALATFLVAVAGLVATLVVMRLLSEDEPRQASQAPRPGQVAPIPPPAVPAAPVMPQLPPAPVAPPRVTLPAHCPANGTLAVDGEQGVFTQPVITAEINCTITIRGSKLTGPQIVSAGQNVKVYVEDSTLEGTDVALDGGLNFEAKISGNSTVTGSFAGLRAGTNAKLRIEGSRVAGGRVGIMADTNAEIVAVDSTIEITATTSPAAGTPPTSALPAAMQTGLLANTNARITLTRSHVRSPHTALWASLNGEINTEASTIEGGEIAIKADGNLTASLVSTTTAGRIEEGRGGSVQSR